MDNIKDKIRYGLFDFGYERELAFGSFEFIYKDIQNIKHNCISLGFHLREMKVCEYYKDLGYSDFMECVEKNFGLDKSAVSRYINLWENFCATDDSGGKKMWIDEKYKDYGYSQLCEMLSLPDEERKEIKPDMTVSQIRDVKKQLRESKKVATSQPDVADTEPEEKNYLTYDDLIRLRGAALNNKLKSVEDVDSIVLYLVDTSTGKVITGNVWADVLYKGKPQRDSGTVFVIRTNSLKHLLKTDGDS